MDADDVDGIVAEFVAESRESLDRLEAHLVRLETTPDPRDLLARVFRVVHTVKGTSGSLGFAVLEQLAHAGEDLLAALVEGRSCLSPTRIDVLLDVVDEGRALLDLVERTGSDDGRDVRPVVARVRAAASDHAGGDTTCVDRGREPERAPDAGGRGHGPGGPGRRPAHEPSVRVDVGVLDALVALVADLALARDQLLHAADRGDAGMVRAAHRLDVVTDRIRESVLRTRVQCAGDLWVALPRLVRDVAAQCGKQVELRVAGHRTELDRTVLAALRDPLTHLVRNAVDHGIEAPEVRRAAGKPETGTLAVRAFRSGDRVVIDVSDDGAGVDTVRVAALAVEQGLVPEAATRGLSDAELADLVFRPGFSTASELTNVSGRGVGLDAVRAVVEALGGTVGITSEAGRGSTVRVAVPPGPLAVAPSTAVARASARPGTRTARAAR